MTPREALLTAAEIAEELKVDPETVRRWVRDGKLSALTLPSGHRRFRWEDVEAILRGEQNAEAAS